MNSSFYCVGFVAMVAVLCVVWAFRGGNVFVYQ